MDKARITAGKPWRGKRLLATVLLILLVGLVAGCGGGTAGTERGEGVTPRSQAPEGPRLALSATSFDFGRIGASQVVSHSFTISNTGGSDLIIEKVATSCGCTTAEVSARAIAPGGTAELLVTFDPGVHQTVGRVMRLVYLFSNDPQQPQQEVSISAEVMAAVPGASPSRGPRLVFRQEEVDLGRIPLNQMVMYHFEFANLGDAPLLIEEQPTVQLIDGC